MATQQGCEVIPMWHGLSRILVVLASLVAIPIAQANAADRMKAASVSMRYPKKEAGFLAENDTAMGKMMRGMAIAPTGDADADFAAMMIPHHQGAIEMAIAELHYGKNEQLRRIAQEIIVDQQQEIAAMRLALGQNLPPSTAAPTQVAARRN